MEIKNHQLYPQFIVYLETKKMSQGAKSLAEISQSMFFDFTKKWENSPGFKEKIEKKLISEQRDGNIDVLLQDEYIEFFKTLDETVFLPSIRENRIKEIIEDDFEILFDDLETKTSKTKEDISDDYFDF